MYIIYIYHSHLFSHAGVDSSQMLTRYLMHTESSVGTPLVFMSQLFVHFEVSGSLLQFP